MLAKALGRVGRSYQAWELYEVIWKHLTNVQQVEREGPSMCEVMARAGPLAWSQVPENKIQSTLLQCMEERQLKVRFVSTLFIYFFSFIM